ncbi:MAG: Flp family type IVb pilin [bacterium]
MKNKIISIFKKSKKGQSLVEYGLILALVSVVAITVLNTMGTQIKNTVTKVNTEIDNVSQNVGTTPTTTTPTT